MLRQLISAASITAVSVSILTPAIARAASPEFNACIQVAAASRQATIDANPRARKIADAQYAKDVARCKAEEKAEEAARKGKSEVKPCFKRNDGNDKPPAGSTVGGSSRR